jgi:predicted GIY-YIG superfamily endonuclease
MSDYAYVYILANGYKKLYIGVTTKLAARIRQHKDRVNPQSHMHVTTSTNWFTLRPSRQ